MNFDILKNAFRNRVIKEMLPFDSAVVSISTQSMVSESLDWIRDLQANI